MLEAVVCDKELLLWNYYLIIPVLNLEQGLSVCDGKLGDHRTRVKKCPMRRNVVAVCLL